MENEELGRRAVACKHWRWMAGMLGTNGRAILAEQAVDGLAFYRNKYGAMAPIEGVPDLSDPATLGCLLSLVREAWGDGIVVLGGLRTVAVYPRTEAVTAWLEGDAACPVWVSDMLTNEAEALVAALEEAPRVD